MFSPLQVGKQWLYGELEKLAQVETKQGYETKELRNGLGLKKTGRKTAEVFEVHCVDSSGHWLMGGQVGTYSLITNSFSVSRHVAFIAVNCTGYRHLKAVFASPMVAPLVTSLSATVSLNIQNED